jgi:menaquinone-9 beta-reductase
VSKHDVVIIGGSLAGAACARELERLGIDAVALERDRFPRRKVCGGFLSPGAVECIARLGLLPDVRNAGAVEVASARLRVDHSEFEIPFERPGLGISRSALDTVIARGAPVQEGYAVNEVKRRGKHFSVDGILCTVVIDAAGKLSRFTKRDHGDEFGIQYIEPGGRGDVLDFWFFAGGYGGAVSVEGSRSNFCFLIKKSALKQYLNRSDCLVTGPIAYDRVPSDFIAIGDAAGMVDPFCGEGMRHALETGILAADVIARGIRRRATYDEMKFEYESRQERRWAPRRALAAVIRRSRKYLAAGLRLSPSWLLNRLWD